MEELRIDPEFQNKIPPLTDAEFAQLRENILTAGEVYEPLVTWNGVIVDGHNRWKVIQEHPELPWRSRKMGFADKWAAFDWMYKNQLGRRNLTEAQRTYLVGKMYEARKKSVGGNGSNQYTKEQCMQNAGIAHNNGRTIRTDETVAKELGINPSTVDRAAHFARGIDTIRETDPETANAILTGELTPKKVDVAAIGKAKETSRAEMINTIRNGKRIAEGFHEGNIIADKPKACNGGTNEHRIEMTMIADAASALYGTSALHEYTLSDLVAEITNTAKMFINTLRNAINDHEDIARDNSDDVKECINETITTEIEKIMEGLK